MKRVQHIIHASAMLVASGLFAAPFDNWDKDGSGTLSRAEVPAPLQRNFDRVDANGDGLITREEDRIFRQKSRSTGDSTMSNRNRAIPANVKVHEDIAYVSEGSAVQKLDLFLPASPEEGEALPVIVFIHGGGWQNGSKTGGRIHLLPYVSSGRYAGVSVGYRLSGEAQWPAQIHDCKAAIRWIKANAKTHGLNADKIAVWGSSAGGHLVAMLGVTGEEDSRAQLEGTLGEHLEQNTRVSAVVDYFGPTSLLTMTDPASAGGHNAPHSPESRLIGGPIQENKAKATQASPLSWVTSEAAPFFVAHGTADRVVPFDQSTTMVEALKKVGVPVYFQQIKEGGHGRLDSAELVARRDAFLADYLLDQKSEIKEGELPAP